MNLITAFKKYNPICKLLQEHSKLCQETQTLVADRGKEVLKSLKVEEKNNADASA